MAIYRCEVCDYDYDESKEKVLWEDLADDWLCPVCDSGKLYYNLLESKPEEPQQKEKTDEAPNYLRASDDFEVYMADIHKIADSAESITQAMRAKPSTRYWDEVLFKGAQLFKLPTSSETTIHTKTIIGQNAKKPLEIETPIIISHMSFGALSKEAKISLAKGSALAKTAMSSGEGGILPESLESSHKYIFEYVPKLYSVNKENLKKVDAIEIKIGQSAKPGLGGHLPANKVTKEIAEVRGIKEGEEIKSPSSFADIKTKEELKSKIDELRNLSGGKPIGVKIAAGYIEEDLEIIAYAKPDFITIDGSPGATGSALKYIKQSSSIPTLFALSRARKFLDKKGENTISLIVTGGLRISSDFAKALALGADAIAIATSALIACGCQQYRSCNTGKCPAGLTSQDPEIRKRINIEKTSQKLANFLNVSTKEIQEFARMTGNDNVHKLCVKDLCTTNQEISNHTDIEHA